MLKKSTNYKGKKYYLGDEEIKFRRVWGGIGWPGDKEGSVVVLGEEDSFNETHWYVLAEGRSSSMGELITMANKLTTEVNVTDWFSKHAGGSEEILNQKNTAAFKKRGRGLIVADAPGLDDKLGYFINIS